MDRGAVRPPSPAAVTGSRRHRGLTGPGGGGTTSPATPRGMDHQALSRRAQCPVMPLTVHGYQR